MNDSEHKKILIVEDEAIVACDIQNCLKDFGYDVVGIAASGDSAIAKARKLKPHLVLMDITLKGPMDGVETASRIRAESDIPVVFLTAHADEFTLERAKKAQAYGFIIKPFEERDIRTSVEIALYKHKTELKLSEYDRARKEAERLYQEANEANRLKDEFLAAVSHELRTPLNPILGYLDLLKSHALSDQCEYDNALEVIHRNAKSLSRLVEDLLDTSRIITGKLKLNNSVIHIPAVALSVVESLDLAAKSKRINVQVVTAGLVRPVYGDYDRLQQAIWNLLSNAIKFTPQDGEVKITIQERNSKVEIRVSDTGEGINPQFIPHVFERFRQEDGSFTRSHGGLGLGLAIVRHILEMHGGEVDVVSKGKGEGSTFIIRMPILSVADIDTMEAEMIRTSIEALPGQTQTLSGVRVLLIEDSPDSRALVKKVLEWFGACVTAVESAKLALEELRKQKPDVVLCDIGMPEMDGYTFIKIFRAMQHSPADYIPAAALTAYVGGENRLRALESGFEEHISKPVEVGSLVNVVNRLAKGSVNAG